MYRNLPRHRQRWVCWRCRGRFLYTGVCPAAYGDVCGEVGLARLLDGRKNAHWGRIRPAVAANVGDSAEVLRKHADIFGNQSEQPSTVSPAVGDRVVLDNVSVTQCRTRAKGLTEAVHANAGNGEFAGVLWQPAGRNRHDHVSRNAPMLDQWQSDTRPATRGKRQEVYPLHCLQHPMYFARYVDCVPNLTLHGRRLHGSRTPPAHDLAQPSRGVLP